MNRRSFLSSCLALAAAPAIVRADSLMRIVPRDVAIVAAPAVQSIYTLKRQLDEARNECERLHRALAEIREEWCGAECGEPVTAQEAYAIGLCKRMYVIACDSISVAQFEKMEQAAVKLATAMKGTE